MEAWSATDTPSTSVTDTSSPDTLTEDLWAGVQLVRGAEGETAWVFVEGPAEGEGGKIRGRRNSEPSCNNSSEKRLMMGNEQSVAAEEREEAKMEPSPPSSTAGPKGRERGQSDDSRSRSASPQKKRHQKEDHETGEQQVKQQEKRPAGDGGVGGGDNEEEGEEDEWLQGSAALGAQGSSKGKGGGAKKKGKKGAKAAKGAGGSPLEKEQLSPAGREQSDDAPPSTPPKAVPAALARGKCVRWGGVVVQTFQRKPSQDSVPASGAWPLGLGEADGEGAVQATVDAFEAARAEEIERRISELPKRLRKVCMASMRVRERVRCRSVPPGILTKGTPTSTRLTRRGRWRRGRRGSSTTRHQGTATPSSAPCGSRSGSSCWSRR